MRVQSLTLIRFYMIPDWFDLYSVLDKGERKIHHPITKYAKQGLLVATLASGFGLAAGPANAGNSLASTLEVYVFPTAGQASDQQSMDEAECFGLT